MITVANPYLDTLLVRSFIGIEEDYGLTTVGSRQQRVGGSNDGMRDSGRHDRPAHPGTRFKTASRIRGLHPNFDGGAVRIERWAYERDFGRNLIRLANDRNRRGGARFHQSYLFLENVR